MSKEKVKIRHQMTLKDGNIILPKPNEDRKFFDRSMIHVCTGMYTDDLSAKINVSEYFALIKPTYIKARKRKHRECTHIVKQKKKKIVEKNIAITSIRNVL